MSTHLWFKTCQYLWAHVVIDYQGTHHFEILYVKKLFIFFCCMCLLILKHKQWTRTHNNHPTVRPICNNNCHFNLNPRHLPGRVSGDANKKNWEQYKHKVHYSLTSTPTITYSLENKSRLIKIEFKMVCGILLEELRAQQLFFLCFFVL